MFCLMPSLMPISWKSYYAALLLPYMALVAAVWPARDQVREHDRKTNLPVTVLFAISVLLNLAPGNYLARLAMFYSAHFISSLLALAALFTLSLRDEHREDERSGDIAKAGAGVAAIRA